MAVKLGYLGLESIYPTGWSNGISSDLDDYTFDPSSYNTLAPYFDLYGARVDRMPVEAPSRELDVFRVESFFEDFYFRIYLQPSKIDVGNVLGNQERSVTLWNAFPYAPATMTTAGVVGDAGITATLPPGVTLPYELAPLLELTFNLNITLAGPPNVDARFVVTVDGEQYAVVIVGRRIVLFPFRPQWRSYVDETVNYPSWVIPATDGTEQSGETVGAFPRRSFEYTTVAKDMIEAQQLENLLFAWQGRFFGLPIWTERKRLTSAVPAGSGFVPFDTEGFSAEPGSLIVLWSDDGARNEIREVQEVTPTGVSMVTLTELDWNEDDEVYPVAVALLNADVQFARETVGVGRLPLSFETDPIATPPNVQAETPSLTYLGEELYLSKINWRSALPTGFASDRKKIDYGSAKIAAFTQRGYSVYSRRHNWQLLDVDEIQSFRSFLGRRRGVARPVWMPSGMADFTVAGNSNAGDNFLIVEPNAYSSMIEQHPARRDIIVYMNDGTFFCRRITESASVGNMVRLQFDENVGVDITPEAVMRVSFLSRYRFSSPAVTMRHVADRKVVVDADMVTTRKKGDV